MYSKKVFIGKCIKSEGLMLIAGPSSEADRKRKEQV